MDSRNQLQLGRASSQPIDDVHPIVKNIQSLHTILGDITDSLGYQINGNCTVLEQLGCNLQEFLNSETNPAIQSPENINEASLQASLKAFRIDQLELLIRMPTKNIIYRCNGLRKVVNDIKRSAEQIVREKDALASKVLALETKLQEQVSSGNSQGN
jgi:hypothetical protein